VRVVGLFVVIELLDPEINATLKRGWSFLPFLQAETGHPVQLHFGYDVRDEHWLERLPYDRLAEIEAPRESTAKGHDCR
jgi:hypothetical protein